MTALQARAALLHAIELAQLAGAEVRALWVRETVPYFVEVVGEITAEEDAARIYFGK